MLTERNSLVLSESVAKEDCRFCMFKKFDDTFFASVCGHCDLVGTEKLAQCWDLCQVVCLAILLL